MHKLAKGLKKKKKSKKGKKGVEEDEFDPEELERYRRERAEAQEKAAALESSEGGPQEGGNSGGAAGGGAGSDEWQKFQALTAGVDSILKKTQGDLDRIKSTSFFQRKPPVEDQKHKKQKEAEAIEEEARTKAKRWVGFDKEGNPIEGGQQDVAEEERGADNQGKKSEKEGKKSLVVNEEGFVEIPDDDDDEDDSAEEDIFDTTYVDVLQNIDVQLAYIPDSPTEEDAGDDPFDTSNADKVLKTVDKKGNKLVSLGNAVEVLSGRIDHVSTCKISRPRKAPLTQDLLLDDAFNESDSLGNDTNETTETFIVEKTLLDDDSDLPDVPIDLTKLPPVLPKPVSTPLANDSHNVPPTNQLPLDISEFEVLKEKTILEEIPDLDDAEFDLGASDNFEPVCLDEAEDPFGTKETEQTNFEAEIIEASFEAASFVDEEDPFDTTFAENILPGKTELKFIEKELEELPISADVSISLTDPAGLKRDYETGLLSSDPSSAANVEKQSIRSNAEKQDLLGGSCTDLSQLNDKPIQPAEEITYVDPFDTSSVRELPPGQTELKFLEEELLGSEGGKIAERNLENFDDDDFDPRKEESKVAPPPRPSDPSKPSFQVNFEVDQAPTLEEEGETAVVGSTVRKPSRPEVLGLGVSKTVNFELPTPSKRPDLLQTSEEEKSIASTKPLTPYYSQKSLEEALPEENANDAVTEVDPFDTSFVGKVAPGKTELKLIETELLAKQETSRLKHSISDHDFDPRSASETALESEIKSRRQSDFGTVNIPKSLKVEGSEVSLIEENEPFAKTCIFEVNKVAYRGKSENKRQESLLDADVEVNAKPLTPRVETTDVNIDEISYVDPFDTSIATNILPGKAELKLLENELSELPTEIQRIRVNTIDLDRVSAKPASVENTDDFDPRAGESLVKESPDFLSLQGQDPGDKVLTPLQDREFFIDGSVDPFDTSFASIKPGKTELTLLESELMDK